MSEFYKGRGNHSVNQLESMVEELRAQLNLPVSERLKEIRVKMRADFDNDPRKKTDFLLIDYMNECLEKITKITELESSLETLTAANKLNENTIAAMEKQLENAEKNTLNSRMLALQINDLTDTNAALKAENERMKSHLDNNYRMLVENESIAVFAVEAKNAQLNRKLEKSVEQSDWLSKRLGEFNASHFPEMAKDIRTEDLEAIT